MDKLEFLTKSLNSCVFNMATYMLRTFFCDESADSDDNEEIINFPFSTVSQVIDSIEANNRSSPIPNKTSFCFGESSGNVSTSS